MSTVSLNGVEGENSQLSILHSLPAQDSESTQRTWCWAAFSEWWGNGWPQSVPGHTKLAQSFFCWNHQFFQYTFRDLLKFKQKQISFTGQTSSTTLGSLRLKMENPRSCKHLMKRCPPKQIPFQDVQWLWLEFLGHSSFSKIAFRSH